MKIKDIPWFNRPGFKLTRKGVNSLDDAELLSIIFWTNDKEDDILDISNKILKKYNLHKLEIAGYKELVNLVCNKKKAKYKDFIKVMKLLSLIELAKRYNKLTKGGYNNEQIKNTKDVFNIFVDRFKNYKKENLSIVLLDSKNKIIGIKEGVSIGTLNNGLVHPREIFKEAIKESANSIILVHNHPSGDSTPSKQDLEVTKILMKAGETLDIPVIDHIIIGNEDYYSFKEKSEQI